MQEEIARRNSKRKIAGKNAKTENGKYSSKYALSDILFRGRCGTQYRRVTWARNGTKKIVWRCINRLEYGKKFCADLPTIDEDRLQTAIIRAISLLVEDRDEMIDTLKVGLSIALGSINAETDTFAIKRRIKEVNAVMIDLVQVSAKSDADVEYFDEQFKQISDEIKALQEQLNFCQQEQSSTQNRDSRLGEIFETLENRELALQTTTSS